MERCGKINASNSGSESWTGIGVVAGFGTVVLIMQWPHERKGEVTWRSELLQRLQEVRTICKTRNQLYTSYKVANILVEFSTNIPRTQLRPGYGDGFLGAPLHTARPSAKPSPREQGGHRGTSSTHPHHTSGGAPHV